MLVVTEVIPPEAPALGQPGREPDASRTEPALAVEGGASAPDPRTDAARPTPDAGAVVIGGAPGPCKHQLCESFEAYADGAKPDPAVWRSGGVAVGSTRAARGSKALRVVARGIGEWFIRETRTFPAANGRFFGRVFFWIEQQPTTPFVHWTLVEASERAAGGGRVVRYGGFFNPDPARETFWFNIETHATGETGTGDYATTIPLHTWHCIEWSFDTAKNEAHMWWNGVERPKLRWTDSRPSQPQFDFPAFQSLSLGWAAYQRADAGFEVWIDEIAVDGERIGCD